MNMNFTYVKIPNLFPAESKSDEEEKSAHSRQRRNTWDPTKPECTLEMVVSKEVEDIV